MGKENALMGFMVLTLVGGLIFLVAIIMLIVAFASKKPKKVPAILLLSSIIITIVGSVGFINTVLKEEYGDEVGISDFIYVKRVTEPLNEVNDALDKYNNAIESFDMENQESKDELQSACDNLITKSKNMKSINSSNKDWSVYKDIQMTADKFIQIGERTPNAYLNDDLEEQSKILELYYQAMDHMGDIISALS